MSSKNNDLLKDYETIILALSDLHKDVPKIEKKYNEFLSAIEIQNSTFEKVQKSFDMKSSETEKVLKQYKDSGNIALKTAQELKSIMDADISIIKSFIATQAEIEKKIKSIEKRLSDIEVNGVITKEQKSSKPKPQIKKQLEPFAEMKRNTNPDGIEIYFKSSPGDDIKGELRGEQWKWHGTKKCWYKKYSVSAEKFAKSICERVNESIANESL